MNERDLKALEYCPIEWVREIEVNLPGRLGYKAGWNAALESESVKKLVRIVEVCEQEMMGTLRIEAIKARESFTKAKGGT